MLIILLLFDSFDVSETNFSITCIGDGGSCWCCSGLFDLDVMFHQNYMYSQFLFFALLLCSILTTHEDNINLFMVWFSCNYILCDINT
jgi:hypothetical protein